jgi:uncharacterized membrane protein
MTLIGFLFSGYLTYREIFSIKAICEECATSAVFMTILLIISAVRYVRGDPMPSPPSDPSLAAPAASPNGKRAPVASGS